MFFLSGSLIAFKPLAIVALAHRGMGMEDSLLVKSQERPSFHLFLSAVDWLVGVLAKGTQHTDRKAELSHWAASLTPTFSLYLSLCCLTCGQKPEGCPLSIHLALAMNSKLEVPCQDKNTKVISLFLKEKPH